MIESPMAPKTVEKTVGIPVCQTEAALTAKERAE